MFYAATALQLLTNPWGKPALAKAPCNFKSDKLSDMVCLVFKSKSKLTPVFRPKIGRAHV